MFCILTLRVAVEVLCSFAHYMLGNIPRPINIFQQEVFCSFERLIQEKAIVVTQCLSPGSSVYFETCWSGDSTLAAKISLFRPLVRSLPILS